MERAASSPWQGIARQAWDDLQPFPGRFAMTWRVALLCALVAGVAMLYKIPESAIGCYLIIFLARPNGAECVAQAIGVIALASIVVLAMAPLVQATADWPLIRICVIALVSFAFVFLGAASQLGEQGSIVALVVAFVLTLVDQVPAGEIVTRGLLYAWQMACVPMMMMIVFNLVFGASPQRLMRATIRDRLTAAADALERPGPEGEAALRAALAEGNGEVGKRSQLAQLFHTAPAATVTWLRGASMMSYRLLLAVTALPPGIDAEARVALARRCREAAAAVAAGRQPEGAGIDGEALATSEPPALAAAQATLAALSQSNGGTDARPAKPPFLAADAFANPDYQRYALKTTAAAISCYLIYSLIDWQGIHTAMITCYVAALGTTAETVHKLALRIAGCLVGAAMGFLSILFIIPHLESVGGLMALVFAAILVAAWISSGSERISYAGVQVGLAFLLTVLDGFAPSLSMESGRDRIVGILLGNVVVYLFFTGIWPRSASVEVRERLTRALAALAGIAALGATARSNALDAAEIVEKETAEAREQLALLPFEPASERPSAAWIAGAGELAGELRALLPDVMFSAGETGAAAERLTDVASRLGRMPDADHTPPEFEARPPSGDLAARIARIERLAAEVTA